MPSYTAPLDDLRFVLQDLHGFADLTELPGYEEATPDLFDAVMAEAAKLCENELAPLNLPGDAQGCQFENGVVRTPEGFKAAYDQLVEGGWLSLSADPKWGGQGLPHSFQVIFSELVSGANLSFGTYPGLTQGAMNLLRQHGSESLCQRFMPRMVEGRWSGTMCLTEPQCGTDLGLIRTKAVPEEGGNEEGGNGAEGDAQGSADEGAGNGEDPLYRITGTKIYISAGEHDLTDNIIHMVLARLPDAPEGVKGISLFAVPKFMPREENGELVAGEANGVSCGAIEKKMGIKASATCVMNYEQSRGWLIGEPHKGLRAMFTMMNEARLAVGLQGLGLSEVSYQNALAYARERLQGRALSGPKYPDRPADPILVHPDVRRNLLVMKSLTEGMRALAYWVAYELDVAERHGKAARRERAEDFVALLTPVVKGFFTDASFQTTNLGVQIHGGAGYIHEYGVEQFVRDARICQIYEGANGIQALDLVGRKLAQNYGRALRRFFHPVQAWIEAHQESEDLQEFLFPFMKGFGKLQQATATIVQKGLADPEEAGAASSDYLRLFGLVAIGFMWLRMAALAQQRLAAGDAEDPRFYRAKIKTARFFFERVFPEINALNLSIMAGGRSMMDLEEAEF